MAAVELKNPVTAQTWRQAVTRYKSDRAPADLIFQFKKRTFVHFAAGKSRRIPLDERAAQL